MSAGTYTIAGASLGRAADRALLPVFAGTLFVSAVLLFSVQPMFTKMVLPLLGGSPSVWSVAMVFFQAMLLAGYAYAHGLTRWVRPGRAVMVHLAVCALAFTALPLAIATGFGTPPADAPALWLIGVFGVSIGLPFFAVAANAPILQAWFGRTGHPDAADPYFLYGVSNLGSFASLLAYPLLIEPLLTLHHQSQFWSAGFALLTALIAVAGVLMLRMRAPRRDVARAEHATAGAVTSAMRLNWVALAFVPSALLIAVTSHISTDIAAAPFLWVVPLALFLGTFVVTFRTGGEGVHRAVIRLQPYVVAPLVIGLMWGERAYWLVAILLDLGFFVIAALICHRELYRRRPDVNRLTEFYMWISVGGVAGGIASGLIAPAVFPDVWEYPILIIIALLCRPGAFADRAAVMRVAMLFFIATLAMLAPRVAFGATLPESARFIWMAGLVVLAAVIMLQAAHALSIAALSAFVLIMTSLYEPGVVLKSTQRSFFGVHKVVESYDGRFRILQHGTIAHGAQRIRDENGNPVRGRPEPLTYYYHGSPLVQSVQAMRAAKGTLQNVAVVGLGTGSLACYATPGERWSYFEIDPVVAQIARDPTKFRFLSDCAPNIDVVIGDGRLTLAKSSRKFDLIVLDAFSSDVVPVHLLTTEALDVYRGKLSPGGAIAFHISNRYVELGRVVSSVASAKGMVTYLKRDTAVTEADYRQNMYASSLVAVVARKDQDLVALRVNAGWTKQLVNGSVTPWSDDYSNILAAIWRMHRYH